MFYNNFVNFQVSWLLLCLQLWSVSCEEESDSSDQEEEERKDSFEIFKGSSKSLCEEVLQTKM